MTPINPQPAKVISTEISCSANIYLVNKEFNQIYSDKSETIKKIDDLVNKYNKYTSVYKNLRNDWLTGKKFDPKGNPLLLDALFTGCRLSGAASTFMSYTPEIEQDIKDIVKLMPQSMNCILGTLRSRDEVLPLAAACFNVNIPLHIIEFLLQQGANPNATYKLNGRPISILADLEDNLDAKRFAAIKVLFSKYDPVEISIKAFQFASDDLKNNKRFVLEFVFHNREIFKYIRNDFKGDVQFMLEAVKRDGLALKYANEDLKDNWEIVFAALKQNISALAYASDDIKNHSKCMEIAVKYHGDAFKYVGDQLKNDAIFMLEMIKQDESTIEYIGSNLTTDIKFMFEIVQRDGLALWLASEQLKDNWNLVFAALKQNISALRYASPKLKNDYKFMFKAVQQNGLALAFASDFLKKDKELVLEAVRNFGKALKFASYDLRDDRDVVNTAIQQDKFAIQYASRRIQEEITYSPYSEMWLL